MAATATAAATTVVVADDHDAEAETKRVLSTAAGWDGNEEAARRFREWLEDETEPLNLGCCNLIRLPNCIGTLSSLSMFFCAHNQLTSLPDTFGNLTSLTYLSCAHNQLTGLPDTFGNLTSLTYLSCAHNPLASLPYSLGHLPLLTELSCYNNKIPEGEPSTIEELQAIARRRSVKGRTGC